MFDPAVGGGVLRAERGIPKGTLPLGGVLFPHFLSLLKENGQDRRENFIEPTRYPRKGSAPRHDN